MPSNPQCWGTLMIPHLCCQDKESSTPEILFSLYCQGLARSNSISFHDKVKEFNKDFVTSRLAGFSLLTILNFPLQNSIFRCKSMGFGFAKWIPTRRHELTIFKGLYCTS